MSLKYQKLSQRDHVLLRPETYVSSVKPKKVSEFVAESTESGYIIRKKVIEMSPAVLRIFLEILYNATDNYQRSIDMGLKMTKLVVTLDQESGTISVLNDGYAIPIVIDEDQGLYNHSFLFGDLLTGSNFDDTEVRTISGRNGIGASATNVLSTFFQVEGVDPNSQKKLVQTWKDNMGTTAGPKITSSKLKRGYTKVTFIPDFSRLGVPSLTDDLVALYTRYVIDAAMLTGVKVTLNDEIIPVKKLAQYVELYESPSEDVVFINTEDCQVAITPCTEYQPIGFVNNLYTQYGGVHVDAWAEAVFRPIIDKFNKSKTKSKTPKINITDVSRFFRLFVVATLDKPTFNNQSKEVLESPTPIATVKKSVITNIMKWPITEQIESIVKGKELTILKKIERKRGTRARVKGLDSANNAGNRYSTQCSLIVCEGDSAKTFVVAGLKKGVFGKSGRDWFGILALTGKILNVRKATIKAIAENKVVADIIQALNIKSGVDYTDDKNFRTLDYGKIICASDQDVDGFHIKGLLINIFHYLFPSILERDEPFFISMETPIARVFRSKLGDLIFYDEKKYKEWLAQQKGNPKTKYYKGLGTTHEDDVPDIFGEKMVRYTIDEDTNENMEKAFSKKHITDRKNWLTEYDPANTDFSLDDGNKVCDLGFSDFINNILIQYSYADCERNIPSLIDGQKKCQRKILYCAKKRKLGYSGKSIKVAQFGGYTAEHSNYHHGEQNLHDTTVGMAQGFPGKNNIPLLYPDGAFGTRLAGGSDAANARYIYTKMDVLTELIFRQEDEPLLTPVIDDGDSVEPEFYVPIIPMILVNGPTAAIGTGWSCSIPNYNPLDLIAGIKLWLENAGNTQVVDPDSGETNWIYPEFVPWYRGFNGTIEPSGKNRYITRGIVVNDGLATVSELPIGMWTNNFKEFLDKLIDEEKVADVKNYCTPKDVHFVIQEFEGGMECTDETLKLHSYVHTSNMVLFDDKNKLSKYDTVNEIMDKFCEIRYEYYIKRKKHQISGLEKDIRFLSNKERFIIEVKSGEITLITEDDVGEQDLVSELESRGYDKETIDNTDNTDENSSGSGYEYLLRMQVRTFTAEKIRKLRDEIKSTKIKLDKLKKTSEAQMWINDLDELEVKYTEWLTEISSRKAGVKKVSATRRK